MKNRTLFIFLGIVSVLAGFFALLNPLAGSIAAETVAAWAFLIIGVIQIIGAFSETTWGARIWTVLIGIIAVIVGIDLVADPLGGVVSLTFVLAVLFIASGIFKLVAAFGVQISNLRWLVILSGALSLILGILILSYFPGSAVFTLGVLLGFELISDGAALLGLAWAGRDSRTA